MTLNIKSLNQDKCGNELVYIVIAAYNEASVITSIIKSVKEHYKNIVVIDDGSTDSTAITASQAGAVVLRHIINRGQGAALKTGIDYALMKGASVIVTFDADGQHKASEIQNLVIPILEHKTDIVLGSRFLEHSSSIPFTRRVLLLAALQFTRLVTGLKITDTHNGFRAFSRTAALSININQDRMSHASEILDQIRKKDLNYLEIPTEITYTEYSRKKGQRKIDAIRVLFDYIINRVLL